MPESCDTVKPKFSNSELQQLLRRASAAQLAALAPADLPWHIDENIVFEAPLELSANWRDLIQRAQVLQQSQLQKMFYADLGESGREIIELCNSPQPSLLERSYCKQLAGIANCKQNLRANYSEAAEQLLHELRQQLRQSFTALREYAAKLQRMRALVQQRSFDKSRRQFGAEYRKLEADLAARLAGVLQLLADFKAGNAVDNAELLQGSAHLIAKAWAALDNWQQAPTAKRHTAKLIACAQQLPPPKLGLLIKKIMPSKDAAAKLMLFTLLQKLCAFSEQLLGLWLNDAHFAKQATAQLPAAQLQMLRQLLHIFISEGQQHSWQQLAMLAKLQQLQTLEQRWLQQR